MPGPRLCPRWRDLWGVRTKKKFTDYRKTIYSEAFQEVTIPAKDKFQNEILLEKNSQVEWEFKTDGRDVGFGIFFKDEVPLKLIEQIDKSEGSKVI